MTLPPDSTPPPAPAPERMVEKKKRRWPRLAAWRRLLRAHPRLRRILYGIGGVLGLLLAVTVWLLFPYLKALGDIGDGPENAPSRLYGAPAEVRVGEEMDGEDL